MDAESLLKVPDRPPDTPPDEVLKTDSGVTILMWGATKQDECHTHSLHGTFNIARMRQRIKEKNDIPRVTVAHAQGEWVKVLEQKDLDTHRIDQLLEEYGKTGLPPMDEWDPMIACLFPENLCYTFDGHHRCAVWTMAQMKEGHPETMIRFPMWMFKPEQMEEYRVQEWLKHPDGRMEFLTPDKLLDDLIGIYANKEGEVRDERAKPGGSVMEFTPRVLKAFKKAYAVAVNLKQDRFMFEGNEVLVSYAKHVIDYVEERFKRLPKHG
jgi:hypothetical protein